MGPVTKIFWLSNAEWAVVFNLEGDYVLQDLSVNPNADTRLLQMFENESYPGQLI
jgi:hypothetical protein